VATHRPKGLGGPIKESFSRKAGNKETKFEFLFNKQQDDKDVWEVTRTIKEAGGPESSEKKLIFYAGNDTVVFDDESGMLSIHKEPQGK